MNRFAAPCAALALALAAGACSGPARDSEPDPAGEHAPEREAPSEARRSGPFIRVVGTVQDGGLPHVACGHALCEAARVDPSRRRRVASLAIVLPATRRVYLIDATPDVAAQLDALADVREPPPDRVDRAPIDGVFLTHAHIGHYLGLALFGYEAVHTDRLPVWATARMRAFLSENGPWDLLVERGNIELRGLERPVDLGEGVEVRAVPVPHRDEYTDTVGFVIDGPSRSVLYVPDTDSWQAWQPSIEEVLAGVEVALLDGTFFSADELPGRDIAAIGHPLIADSLERLAAVVESGTRVAFTHLNHSNPVLDPDSTARARVLQLGFEVLGDGDEIGL